MLATIKLLQAKNASTGTMSMSKRLAALQDAFANSTNNPGPGQLPALVLPNGDVNKNDKNTGKGPPMNPCVSVPNKSSDDKPSNMSTPSSAVTSTKSPPSSSAPCENSKPEKPNSLILVPNQRSIHELSNGLLKSSEECGEVRLVQKPQLANSQAKAKEVQASFSPLQHNEDCPFNGKSEEILANKSSDPFSESSDDYLESSVPDQHNNKPGR